MSNKTITLGDFLTDKEIKRCIGKKKPWITEHIIKPNLKRINKALGQENDADYLGYLVEYITQRPLPASYKPSPFRDQ